MDLLTPAEKAQIQQGLLDAMNTLHQTEVVLFVRLVSLDIRQGGAGSEYDQFILKTIVKEKRKVNDESQKGSRDIDNIELKFHYQDFVTNSLVGAGGQLLTQASECYVTYKSKNYRVVSCTLEDIAVRLQAEPTAVLLPSQNL